MPDQFVPVGVVHNIVDHLLSVRAGHSTGAIRHLVDVNPQSLNDIRELYPRARDEMRGVSGIALLLMPVDVELVYPPYNLKARWQRQIRAPLKPLEEMHSVEAVDVVEDQNDYDPI